jgi:hypothetical protein
LIISSQILERAISFFKEIISDLKGDNLERKDLSEQTPIEMEDWKQGSRESLSKISTNLSILRDKSLKNLSEET